jgi:hypothetical protein
MRIGTAYAHQIVMINKTIGDAVDNQTLRSENLTYEGTRGISQNNRASGFRPAFLETSSGRIEISRLKDGQEAPIHMIGWLPEEWAVRIDEDGLVIELKREIVAGFERGGSFYTRDEAAEM